MVDFGSSSDGDYGHGGWAWCGNLTLKKLMKMWYIDDYYLDEARAFDVDDALEVTLISHHSCTRIDDL